MIQTLIISAGLFQLQTMGVMAEVAKTLPATDVPEPWRPPTWRVWRARPASWMEMQLCEKPSTRKAASA